MKITILDFDDIQNPLLAAGQAKATLEIAKRFIRKGHMVDVISSRYPGSKDRVSDEGIYYRHIGLDSRYIKLNNIAYNISLPFALKSLQCDIILECFTPPFSVLFSPLFTDIPVIAIPTSFEAETLSKRYHLPFHLIEKFGCKFYKYFLPYTKHYENKMKKFNPSVISQIVPEGVDESYLDIERKKPEHILFLGRFDIYQKGIDLLLESYSTVASHCKYPLVIAGHGPDENNIRNLIVKYHLEHYVHIVGSAYGNKKKELLSKSLFVAMPSRFEGFSIFALEALASGLPLLSFDIPGFSWANNGIINKVKPFDLKNYAKAFETLSNDSFDKKMSKRIKDFAKTFTWDEVANKYESFIQQNIT